MSDNENEDSPPHVPATGPSTPGTAATALYSYVPSNFPVPAPMTCKGNLVANWEFFRQQWEDYEIATGLDKQSSKVRLASLRSVMGKECLQTFLNLNIPAENRNNVQACMTALENYFKPQRNVVYERYVFNSCEQNQGESVDSYVTRLRKLASSCEFGTLTDELIRDRLVLGVIDRGTKGKLLREKSLTLDKAIDIARSNEITSKQLESMKSDTTGPLKEDVNLVAKGKIKDPKKQPSSKPKQGKNRFSSRKKTIVQKKCKNCGTQHKRNECPAYNQKCAYCHKWHHFASVCMAKKKDEVNLLQESHECSDSEESVLKVEDISSVESCGNRWFATLSFYSKHNKIETKLKCQLDTGATCNVLSYRDLSIIKQDGNPHMDGSKTKLKLFDGSLMKSLGEVKLQVIHGGKTHVLKFQVVSGTNKPLLSAETCQKLELLKLGSQAEVLVLDVKQTPLTVQSILKDYEDVFKGLGHIGISSFVVDPAAVPVQHTSRRIPIALKKEVKAKLADLERKGIIMKETAPTEWISNMVVVAKPGKIRICLDPQELNKVIQRPKYQMPTLEELLPKLSKAKIFSTLDAKDGFYQISLDEASSKLTTFWTPFGRYRYLRMPFGVSLAPEEFERNLQEKLSDLEGVEVIRDDIIVMGFGETQEQAVRNHDENLVKLLERARKVNLRLNSRKMELKKSEVKFMGHIISKDGLKPDPDKVRAVEEMPQPTCKQEVLSLLGFVNYLSKFLPRLAEVAQPLRDLTTKNAKFTWAKQHNTAFQEVKKIVVNHPVLKYYDCNAEVTLQCDASEKGLGAALLQNGQPVAFASKTLTPTERRYAQIEKECLAIVFACQRFSQYLSRREKITVESDHKPLQSIFKKSVLAAPCRLQRMLLRLQRFNLDVKYKPGSQMYIADHLSRAYLASQGEEDKEFQVFALEVETLNPLDALTVSSERLAQLQKATEQDAELQSLKTTVLVGWPEQKNEVPIPVREYWNYREEISLHNGILFKGQRIIIPKAIRPEIISRSHTSHLGIESCLRKARDSVFWPRMSSDIKEAISQCSVCAEFQPRNTKEPMQTSKVPDRPWSRVAVDLFTLQSKEYVVLVDYYSDFIEVQEINDTTSPTIIQFLKEQFSRHGIPDVLVSDNGPQLTSHEFRRFAEEWEFKHVTSSPHHHMSNGKAEAAVKVTKNLFKKALRDGRDPWLALLEYRNTPVETIGSSPAQRLMSRRTKTLMPTASALLRPQVVEGVENKIELKRQKAKSYFDRTAHPLPPLEVGQDVRVAPLQKGKSWQTGTLVEQLSDRSYVVKTGGETVRRNRHFLKPKEKSTTNVSPKATTEVSTELSVTAAPTGKANNRNVPDPAPSTSTDPVPDISPHPVPATPIKRTRTRVVKPPERFKDFVS